MRAAPRLNVTLVSSLARRRLATHHMQRAAPAFRGLAGADRSGDGDDHLIGDDEDWEYYDDDDEDWELISGGGGDSSLVDCPADRSKPLLSLPFGLETAMDAAVMPGLRARKSTTSSLAIPPTIHELAAMSVDSSYAAVHRTLQELSLRVPGFVPSKILEFGAGLAPGAWAAQDVWPEAALEVVAVEPNEPMRSLGALICREAEAEAAGDERADAPPAVEWRRELPAETSEEVRGAQQPIDLVVAAHSLHLLPPAALPAAVSQLWGRLGAGGVLCVASPATRPGFAATLAARDVLAATRDARLVAPFASAASDGWMEPGAPLQRWFRSRGSAREVQQFHTVQRLVESRPRAYLHRLQRRKKERREVREEVSYVIAQRVPDVAAAAAAAVPAPELVAADALAPESPAWARIVRPPRLRKGHVMMDLATASGAVVEVTYAKRNTPRRCYRHARKALMGHAWHWPLPEEFGRKRSRRD